MNKRKTCPFLRILKTLWTEILSFIFLSMILFVNSVFIQSIFLVGIMISYLIFEIIHHNDVLNALNNTNDPNTNDPYNTDKKASLVQQAKYIKYMCFIGFIMSAATIIAPNIHVK